MPPRGAPPAATAAVMSAAKADLPTAATSAVGPLVTGDWSFKPDALTAAEPSKLCTAGTATNTVELALLTL